MSGFWSVASTPAHDRLRITAKIQIIFGIVQETICPVATPTMLQHAKDDLLYLKKLKIIWHPFDYFSHLKIITKSQNLSIRFCV